MTTQYHIVDADQVVSVYEHLPFAQHLMLELAAAGRGFTFKVVEAPRLTMLQKEIIHRIATHPAQGTTAPQWPDDLDAVEWTELVNGEHDRIALGVLVRLGMVKVFTPRTSPDALVALTAAGFKAFKAL